MSEVLHPELFASVPLTGERTANHFDSLAAQASLKPGLDEKLSVVIRTLNEASSLKPLLEDINAQHFQNEVEIIVVDNESRDGTPQVAEDFGATVVTLPRKDFTYPRSMNLGMEAASHDLVWLTVGHALPTTTQFLKGGSLNFADPQVAGAFSLPILPNGNASKTERLVAMSAGIAFRLPRQVRKAGMGVMGASSCMLRKSIWQELGKFDERYESGGEDTALAGRMLKAGYKLRREPLLSVHHSHNLGPVDLTRQMRYWYQMSRGPQQLDKNNIGHNKPHMNFE